LLAHSITLPGLQFGQQYYYTITATSALSETTIVPQTSFVAATDTPPPLGGDIVYFDGAITLLPKFTGQVTINEKG